MGATNISHIMRDKLDKPAIEQAFRERQANDRRENGHQEGYSGDFQTVRQVDFRFLGKVFPSYTEAENFCLDKAEKWETVVAVYFADKGEYEGEIRTLLAGWGAE